MLSKPVPDSIIRYGKRYNWRSNYHYKVDADKRKQSLIRQGAKAIVLSIKEGGYAVYVLHNLRGVLAK